MAHTTRPACDTRILIHLITPAGTILTLEEEQAPTEARLALTRGPTGDTQAAIEMARKTGMDATIERIAKTTVRVADLEPE